MNEMDAILSYMTKNLMVLDVNVSQTKNVSRDIYTCDMHIMRRLSNSNLVSSTCSRLVFIN